MSPCFSAQHKKALFVPHQNTQLQDLSTSMLGLNNACMNSPEIWCHWTILHYLDHEVVPSGKLWQTLANYDSPRQTMAETASFGKLWQTMARPRQTMAETASLLKFARVCQSLPECA